MDVIPRLARLFGTKKFAVDTFIPRLGPFSRLVGMALPFGGCQMGPDIESAPSLESRYTEHIRVYTCPSRSIIHFFPKRRIIHDFPEYLRRFYLQIRSNAAGVSLVR